MYMTGSGVSLQVEDANRMSKTYSSVRDPASFASAFTTVPAPAPLVLSVNPISGNVAGGDSITINGANFVDGSISITIGNPCTSIVYVSSVQLTCINGSADTVKFVDVVVTNPDGQSGTLVQGYRYTSS